MKEAVPVVEKKKVKDRRETVLITGVTGYLGAHVCKAFFDDGTFKVKGTVRDLKNEKKIGPLRKAFGDKFDEVTLVEAELLDAKSIDRAVNGCQYVVHVASPFPLERPDTDEVLIKPAREGTRNVCAAAAKYRVKRVVVTSSIAACMFNGKTNQPKTIDDWSDVGRCESYPKSKVMAEKESWDFQKSQKAHRKFELVRLLPGLILGPNINTERFTSGDIIKMIMENQMPGVPASKIGLIDVRDCAQAHLAAIKTEAAKNKRMILVSETVWFKSITEWLHEKYKSEYRF